MNKTIVLTGLCCFVLAVVSCHKKVYSGSAETKNVGAKKTYTTEQLVQGETIFRQSCKKCHQLHMPEEFTETKWNKVLPKMISRAGLDPNQAELVSAWIHAHVKAG